MMSAAALRGALGHAIVPGPLEDLRLENKDLVDTLEELKAKQDQLVHLNAELEETNRGVMAMYAQLADELEETNRGVVALYAELDEKTVHLTRRATPRAGSSPTSATSCAARSPPCWAWPGCCSIRVGRRAHRRAAQAARP